MNPRQVGEITIEYKTTESTEWKILRLSPEEYFESEPDGGVTEDSIELHDHAVDYLDVDRQTLQVTRLTLSEAARGARRTITETFWNEGLSRIIERIDTGPEPSSELIIDARFGDSPPTWDVLRVVREDGVLRPVHHGVIRENEDGSQTETRFKV